MYIHDEEILGLLINILDLEDEPENIEEMKEWIDNSGIENVFRKVIEIEYGMGKFNKAKAKLFKNGE